MMEYMLFRSNLAHVLYNYVQERWSVLVIPSLIMHTSCILTTYIFGLAYSMIQDEGY